MLLNVILPLNYKNYTYLFIVYGIYLMIGILNLYPFYIIHQ